MLVLGAGERKFGALYSRLSGTLRVHRKGNYVNFQEM